VKKTFSNLACIVACWLLSAQPATAANSTNTITVFANAGETYESNVYHSNTDEISEWSSFIAPTFIYTSVNNLDNLNISYEPKYLMNHRRDVYTLNNNLDATFSKQVSSKFNLIFTNNFSHLSSPGAETTNASMAMNFLRIEPQQQTAIVDLLFYDISWPGGEFNPMNPAQVAFVQTELQIRYDAASPEIQSEVDGILRQSTDRYQYWSNTTAFDGFYQYDRKNLISFGYSFRTINSDTDYISQNDSHEPYISLQHTLSPELEVLLSYHFSSTSSEISNDRTSHLTSLRTTYTMDHARILYGEYSNKQVSFDGSQTSQSEHRFDIGYDHKFNQHTAFNISTQPFLIERDSRADERGYILDATITRQLQHGRLSLDGRINYSELKTTGSWESFREAWVVKTNFDQKFTEKIKAEFFVSYGKTQSWYNQDKNTYSIYTGGIDTSYPLNKWLDLDLEYRYTLLNSDNDLIDESTNNIITLKVVATDDLWRW
jgi:predicted porin